MTQRWRQGIPFEQRKSKSSCASAVCSYGPRLSARPTLHSTAWKRSSGSIVSPSENIKAFIGGTPINTLSQGIAPEGAETPAAVGS